MKLLMKAMLILLLFAFSGCASLPKPEEMKKDIAGFELPQVPLDGKAMVYVVRPSSLGGLVRFNVYLDDKEAESEMGYNRGSQYIYFSVEPGNHQILSIAENWSEVNISVKSGDVIFIQQDAQMGILMARNSIAKIEGYTGKYHVKHLDLGTVIKTEK
jgi:hypothetical protein